MTEAFDSASYRAACPHAACSAPDACRARGCSETTIAACKGRSGVIAELGYSRTDRCFYVTVDGRERLRSDIPGLAYDFFIGGAVP